MPKDLKTQPRVVTIMAADIISANGLIVSSQESLEELSKRHKAFLHFVQEFDGRMFRQNDEKFFAEFPSAISSLRCAMNLQHAIKRLNAELDKNQHLYLRIGLNIGDVTQQGDNLIGHGVNIASHVETLAGAGGICLARNVYEQVQPAINLDYNFQGQENILGSGIPVSTFTLSGEPAKPAGKLDSFITVLKINKTFRYQLILSIVLALVTADYINQSLSSIYLSAFLQLAVVSSAALFSFLQYRKLLKPISDKNTAEIIDEKLITSIINTLNEKTNHDNYSISDFDSNANVPTLAVLPFEDTSSEQDQSYFSDGLSEELINVLANVKNLNLSSRRESFAFDPKINNVKNFIRNLDIDYYITGSVDKYENRILINIEVHDAHTNEQLWENTYDSVLSDVFSIQDDISRHVAEVLSVNFLPNPSKNFLTSNARAYDFYLRGRDYFIHKGIDNIQHAIDMYTMAGRLDPKFIRAWTDLAETYAIQAIFYKGGVESINNSKRIANKVLLLAPERAETYVALGMAHLSNNENALAAGRFEKAISINENLFEAQHNLARTHYHQGNSADAIRHFEKAAKIENLDFESYALAAPLYTLLGEEEKALETYQKSYERVSKYIEKYPDNQRAYQLGAIALLKLGQNKPANEWAEQALELGKNEPATLYNIACFYSLSGDIEKALDCLSKSITSRSWIENDPELDAIRQHPRYQEILDSLSS